MKQLFTFVLLCSGFLMTSCNLLTGEDKRICNELVTKTDTMIDTFNQTGEPIDRDEISDLLNQTWLGLFATEDYCGLVDYTEKIREFMRPGGSDHQKDRALTFSLPEAVNNYFETPALMRYQGYCKGESSPSDEVKERVKSYWEEMKKAM